MEATQCSNLRSLKRQTLKNKNKSAFVAKNNTALNSSPYAGAAFTANLRKTVSKKEKHRGYVGWVSVVNPNRKTETEISQNYNYNHTNHLEMLRDLLLQPFPLFSRHYFQGFYFMQHMLKSRDEMTFATYLTCIIWRTLLFNNLGSVIFCRFFFLQSSL